jgi:hypothetical protein
MKFMNRVKKFLGIKMKLSTDDQEWERSIREVIAHHAGPDSVYTLIVTKDYDDSLMFAGETEDHRVIQVFDGLSHMLKNTRDVMDGKASLIDAGLLPEDIEPGDAP